MAKKKKSEIKPERKTEEKKPTIQLKEYQKNLIIFGIVFVLLLIVLSPMAFQGLRPGGVDVIGSKGATHQRVEYEKKTGETVYWNSPVFSGMPLYHRLEGKAFNFDTILDKFLDKILYKYIWIYLIGFIGMFFLLRFFRLGYLPSVFGGLAFIFIPHYMSLLSIGHFAKFRPIMYIPLVTFFFVSFLNKKNLLWLIGFIFAFAVEIRTQHYQIIFYQIMILVFIGLYYLIRMLKAKQTRQFWIKLGLVVAASGLIIMMVAQPLFVTGEYTPYSTRGGTGEEGSTGLEFDYATSWSLHPAEMLSWVMPRFFGGTSGELYTGSKVSQLQGHRIPGYWGHMPFNQAYEYIGVVLIFLAIFGLITNFKSGFIKTLLGLFVLSLLLSFGRHFPLVYKFFFNWVPQFNRFRVPSMISVIMQIIIVIWAGFGIKTLIEGGKEKREKRKRNSLPSSPSSVSYRKIIIGIAIFFIILGFIPLLFGTGFSREKPGEALQYGEQGDQFVELLKQARLDMMQTDGIRLIILTVITAALCLLLLQKRLSTKVFSSLILILLLVDQVPYFKKAHGELHDPVKFEQEHFAKTQTDRVLLQDTTYYRVFPITENPFNTNDWSYYHNSIGGYNAAKPRIYQDIIENFIDPRVIFLSQNMKPSWNVIKMLNTKYVISRLQLPFEELSPYFFDSQEQLLTYKVELDPKPAWFVGDIKVIPEREQRFAAMREPSFDPFQTAILEKDVDFVPSYPDSSYVEVLEASFNRMRYQIYTDKPSLLVVSEIFYPGSGGWKCYIGDEQKEIYKTNHVLRSVYIDSPGTYEVLFEFIPETFVKYYHISVAGHIIAYLLLIAGALLTIRRRTESGRKEKGRIEDNN
jgi:hypothetical protein